MPQLIGLKERQLGLVEIETKMKALAAIKEFLDKENPSGLYTLSFDKQRVKLHCPDRQAINDLLNGYRERLVAEIRALAEKHSIEFEEDEEQLLK